MGKELGTTRRRRAALGLLWLLWRGVAAAEDRLGEVVVTAPPAREEAPKDVTSFATVIDTSGAPAGVETLAEALADTAGVQVRRFGGLGDFSTVSVRGFAPGQVQVYLDGVPLSRADNETVNLSDLPLDAVDHVEVYRGTTPLAFAQSGPGGIVNIVSRRPGPTPVTAASASFGSYLTRKTDLFGSASAGAWDALAFGHYLGSKGDFTYTDDQNTISPDDDETVRRQNNAFNQGDLTARVGWRPTPPLALALTSDTFAKDQGVPGGGNVQTKDTTLRTLRQLAHLDARVGGLPFDLEAGAHLLYQRQQFHVPLEDSRVFVPTDTDERTTATGAQVLLRGALGAHMVPGVLFAGGYEQFAETDKDRPAAQPPDRTRVRGTIAAEDEILLFGDRVSVVPGVRWEIFRDDFPGDPGVPPPLRTSGVQVRDFVSPRLGLRVDAGFGLTYLGNIGRYAREPNFRELFGNQGTLKGNPRLQPETAHNRDVGFRWTAPRLGGVLGDAGVEAAYFDNEVDDLIVLRRATASTVFFDNVSRAHVSGGEVSVRARLWDRLGLSGNYTHQDARDDGQNPKTRGQIPGIPADEAYARIDLTWSPARPLPLGAWSRRLWPGRLYYEFNFVGDNLLRAAGNQPDITTIQPLRVGSRIYHGVGLAVALPLAGLQLTFEVKNAGNDQTRDAFDFPLPGRTFFGTVSYGFGGGARAEAP